MKKNLKLYISAALAILLVAGMVAFPPRSLACGGNGLTSEDGDITNCEKVSEESILIAPSLSEEVEKDEEYFSADETLVSEKTANHSLFLAGSDVSSKDSVFGLGFLAGNVVNAAGTYEYGFFAGSSVEVTGEVENDLFVAGNTVKIDEAASIGRDVYAAGNILTISANLNGKVFAAGNRLVLNNVTIDGDFDAEFSSIVITGKSSISGTFKHNEDAIITGAENLSFNKEETFAPAVKSNFPTKILNKLTSILGTLVLTLVAVLLFSKFATKLLKNFQAKDIFKNVLSGLGILILVPIAAIFIMITVVGLPVALVALAFWLLLITFSTPVSGLVLGDILAKKVFKKEKMNLYLKATLGVVLLGLLDLIPIVNTFVNLAVLLFGIGYLFSSLRPSKKA